MSLGSWRSDWGRVGLLWIALLGIAVVSAPVFVSPRDWLGLAVLYALLAMALDQGSKAAHATRRYLGWAASLAVAAALAWQVREQIHVPARAWTFAAMMGVLGALHVVLRAPHRRDDAPRSGAPALTAFIGGMALCVVTAILYTQSNTFRWHLLRHNKLLGTLTYYALSEPVKRIEERDWRERVLEPTPPGVSVVEAASLESGAVARPDIVFVLVDTLRADALDAYGGDPALMPRLNRIARQSVVFEDVLANASWTRPSVASFFTGLLPEQHAAIDRTDRLPESATTLAEVLRDEGYQTAAFVTNTAAVGRDSGFAQGFEHFEEFDGESSYARAERVNAKLAQWLRDRAGHDEPPAPLFLYLHYLDPHTPYLSGGRNSALHGVARLAYDAELRYLDGEIDNLLRMLEHRLSAPPVLLLTSDHGEEFGEHGERGHGRSLYWHNLQLPVLLQIRGVPPARLSQGLEARDFFDLLVRVGRSEPVHPDEWAARRQRAMRYASVALTTQSAFHRPYLSDVYMRRLDTDEMTLIWSAYGPTFELYDRREDPGQRRNLARSAPVVLEDLRRRLESHVRHWTRRMPAEVSEATLERLRALGYLR